MEAHSTSAPKSLRATRPMRAAPAVCELEGPIMMGPITSKMSMFHRPGAMDCKPLFSLYHKPRRLSFPKSQEIAVSRMD